MQAQNISRHTYFLIALLKTSVVFWHQEGLANMNGVSLQSLSFEALSKKPLNFFTVFSHQKQVKLVAHLIYLTVSTLRRPILCFVLCKFLNLELAQKKALTQYLSYLVRTSKAMIARLWFLTLWTVWNHIITVIMRFFMFKNCFVSKPYLLSTSFQNTLGEEGKLTHKQYLMLPWSDLILPFSL